MTARRLSEAQTERLRDYFDEQLLLINRKFLQRVNIEAPPGASYKTLPDLLDDVTKTLDLIWYSIQQTQENSFLVSYLLRLADSFNDYIVGFPGHAAPIETLRTVGKFDDIISSAVDKTLLNATEQVRMASIAQRCRIQIASLLQPDPDDEESDIGAVYENTLTKIGSSV